MEKKIPVATYEEFQAYATQNPNLLSESPWIVSGVIENWPQYEEWQQLDYLRERFGHLEAFAGAPQFAGNARQKWFDVKTSFAQYMDYVEHPERVEEIYKDCWLTGSYEEFSQQDMPLYCGSLRILHHTQDQIFQDLHPLVPEPIENWNSQIPYYYQLYNHFWLLVSLPGALTPLHQDNNGTVALIAQLKGKKRAILYSPDDLAHYYNSEVGYLDPHAPDDADFPTWRSATKWTGDLEKGQMLIVGSMWGHHVETIEKSISVSHDYVNQHNIAAYAAAPEWAEVYGKLLKAKPGLIMDKLPDAFTVQEIQDTHEIKIGRSAMAHILREAVKRPQESTSLHIKRSFLTHLEQHL